MSAHPRAGYPHCFAYPVGTEVEVHRMTVSDFWVTDSRKNLAPHIDPSHLEVFDYEDWVRLVGLEVGGEVAVVYGSQTSCCDGRSMVL